MSSLDHDLRSHDTPVDVELATPKGSMNETSECVEPTKGIVNGVEVAAGVDIDLSLPMNWPLGKKIFNVAVPSLLGFVI